MSLTERYSTTVRGAMIFTGNTLGLGDGNNIRAFITTDTTQQVAGFPPGSTLAWASNKSSAQLNIPAGSTVLYAELQWGGSSVAAAGQDVSASINTAISFTTPIGTQNISPDPATAQTFTFNGNTFYSRSQDVTNIIKNSGSGTYTVGGVPATVTLNANGINNAGWTLGIIYYNKSYKTRNMTLYTGLQGISNTTGNTVDIPISGFKAPPTGAVSARILITGMEGDPGTPGDQVLFGPTAASLLNLTGPNNLSNNFFASQINNANSVSPSVGLIDTTGTDGTLNATPGVVPPQGTRYGWDITNVAATNFVNNQTDGVVQLATSGDAFAVPLLGVQLDAVIADFGDAPDTGAGNGTGNYTTLYINNGPTHELINELMFGTQVTQETDAYQNGLANGDDLSKLIQDDGLAVWPTIHAGTEVYTLDVSYINFTGNNANVYAWIDFNRDGVFQLEEASQPVQVPSYLTNPRSVSLVFNIPNVAALVPGDMTYLRMRITTDTLINTNGALTAQDTRSIGPATDGEVEDYLVTIDSLDLDYGDAPDIGIGNAANNYTTLLAQNGPRHVLNSNLKLGSFETSELDAYQNANATGDDLSKSIQDDGIITTIQPLVAGDNSYTLPVNYINNTGKIAFMYGWIDFNRDGIFELDEASQSVIVDSSNLNPNITNLVFNYPPGTTLTPGDTTFIRLRLTTDLLQNKNSLATAEDTRSIGFANDGEVEDYIISIVGLNITGNVWYDANCDGLMGVAEQKAGNVTVELYSTANPNTPIETVTTDALGNYSFNNLPSGEYFVKVTAPNGYSYTTSNVGTNYSINSNVDKGSGASANITLNANKTSANVNAGLCKKNKISGSAFYDCNEDGILNFNEVLLCGVVFTLIDSTGKEVGETTTDCNGYYEFVDVKAGVYTVRVKPLVDMNYTIQNGTYYGSKPNNLGEFQVTLTNADYTQGYAGFTGNFGLKMKYCISCNTINCNLY